MTTSQVLATLTADQINSLMVEADFARDQEMIMICRKALTGDKAARVECARVISSSLSAKDESFAVLYF